MEKNARLVLHGIAAAGAHRIDIHALMPNSR